MNVSRVAPFSTSRRCHARKNELHSSLHLTSFPPPPSAPLHSPHFGGLWPDIHSRKSLHLHANRRRRKKEKKRRFGCSSHTTGNTVRALLLQFFSHSTTAMGKQTKIEPARNWLCRGRVALAALLRSTCACVYRSLVSPARAKQIFEISEILFSKRLSGPSSGPLVLDPSR